jgi:hypothetical protein
VKVSAQTNSDTIDAVLGQYGALSDEERQENFEASTIKLVLAQIGFSSKQIKVIEREQNLTADWFNEQNYIDMHVLPQRVFRFNLDLLLYEPKRTHELVVTIQELWPALTSTGQDWAWVFKVYGVGRMVATNIDLAQTHLHCTVLPSHMFNLAPFSGFFTRYQDVRE